MHVMLGRYVGKVTMSKPPARRKWVGVFVPKGPSIFGVFLCIVRHKGHRMRRHWSSVHDLIIVELFLRFFYAFTYCLMRCVFPAVMFGCVAPVSCCIGIKSVTFKYQFEGIQGPMMIALVVIINLDFYFAKSLVEHATKETGHIVPHLHNHPLYFTSVACHWCDLCAQRIDKQAYRCKLCDFDVCVICFRKGNKKTSEGLLRGDKGVVEEQQVSTTGYFWRALLLTKRFFHVVIVAFLCLLLNQGARLLLPRFQGSILDHVIHSDREGFVDSVTWMLILSVASGLFGGIRNLCVDIVGRKMANEVRNRLFQSIIHQVCVLDPKYGQNCQEGCGIYLLPQHRTTRHDTTHHNTTQHILQVYRGLFPSLCP